MAYIRSQDRMVYQSVFDYVSAQLDALGWNSSTVADLPFGATVPITLLEEQLDPKLTAMAPNTVAMSEGMQPDDAEGELGASYGGLWIIRHTLFIDVYGESIGVAKALSSDLRGMFTGKLPGTSRYLPMTDYRTASGVLSVPVLTLGAMGDSGFGGFFGGGPWYWGVTAVDSVGGETTISNLVTSSPGDGPGSQEIHWDAVPFASGYWIYRSPTIDFSDVSEAKLDEVGADVTSYIDFGVYGASQNPPPDVNMSVYSVSSSPAPGHMLRFEDVEVDRPLGGAGKLRWEVVKATIVHDYNATEGTL